MYNTVYMYSFHARNLFSAHTASSQPFDLGGLWPGILSAAEMPNPSHKVPAAAPDRGKTRATPARGNAREFWQEQWSRMTLRIIQQTRYYEDQTRGFSQQQ